MMIVAPTIWNDKGSTQVHAAFPCMCGTEGLIVMHADLGEEWGPTFDIAFFEHRAKYDKQGKMGWMTRLKYAWQCIRHGRPFADMACLSPEVATALASTILETLQALDEERQ